MNNSRIKNRETPVSLEMLWLTLFALILAGCGREVSLSDQPPDVPRHAYFEARGRDFTWHFRTLGPDFLPESRDVDFDEKALKVSPRTEVHLQLTSDDYVYTLTAPDGNKEIAVPGMVHTISFVAPESGTYEFRTDPMCGLSFFHDDVQGTMEISADSLTIHVEEQ